MTSLLRGAGSGGNPGAAGGAGGPDLRSLLNSFGGSGNGGSLENNALSGLINQFRGSGNNNDRSQSPGAPSGGGQYGGSPNNNNNQYGGSSNPSAGPSDNGGASGFFSALSSIAGQQITQQLLQRALQGNKGSDDGDSVQNRRTGGLFSENPGSRSPPVSGSGPRGYPTQAPYPSNGGQQSQYDPETRRSSSSNNMAAPRGTTDKPVPYGWNVNVDQN